LDCVIAPEKRPQETEKADVSNLEGSRLLHPYRYMEALMATARKKAPTPTDAAASGITTERTFINLFFTHRTYVALTAVESLHRIALRLH
jgi:hypothetical protein